MMTDLAEEIKTKKIKKYKKRVYFLLRSLYTTFHTSPETVQLLDVYTNIYRPLTDHSDPARLPFKSKGKLAIKAKKPDCLFAMVNHILTQFWLYCEDQKNEVELLGSLIDTEEIIAKGYETYKVAGSEDEGYYLE